MFKKEATTIKEQVERLQQRGLEISAYDQAEHHLKHISYYRLGEYWYSMQSDKIAHIFKPNSRFSDVIALYRFDLYYPFRVSTSGVSSYPKALPLGYSILGFQPVDRAKIFGHVPKVCKQIIIMDAGHNSSRIPATQWQHILTQRQRLGKTSHNASSIPATTWQHILTQRQRLGKP